MIRLCPVKDHGIETITKIEKKIFEMATLILARQKLNLSEDINEFDNYKKCVLNLIKQFI